MEDVPSSHLSRHHFMDFIVNKLENASRILIVGPGVSKYRFFSYVRETAPQIARKVVGCVELEQPHDFLLRNLAEIHLGVVPNPTEV
jgi:stalled ribosome rescue protein Dom34